MRYRNPKNALRTLSSLAAAQGGYFTAKQAEHAGYSYAHLAYHVRAGNFERAGHGLYRIPTLPPAEHDDLLRLSLWSRGRDDRPQAVASHQTALSLYELGDLIPGRIHLSVPTTFRKTAPRGCRLHKRPLESVRSREMGGFKVTTPMQTLEDLAADSSISRDQFDKAVAGAAARGLISPSHARTLRRQRRDIISTSGRGIR